MKNYYCGNINIKYIVYTILLLLSSIFAYFIFFKKTNTENKIIVGMMNGYPPFMDINKDGLMVGSDIDIVTEIEKELNIKIEIKDLGCLSSLFIALEQGNIDVMISGLDLTQKRKSGFEAILYGGTKITEAYFITTKNGPQSEYDLQSKPWIISAEPGSSIEPALDQYPYITKKNITSFADMILQLNQNKVDACLIDSCQIERFKAAMPNLMYFSVSIPEEFIIEGLGILIKKGNSKIKNLLKPVIEKLLENGTIKNIEKKWQISI